MLPVWPGSQMEVTFLRPRIVGTALSLPAHRKIAGDVTKVALKDAFREILPDYVTVRRKQRFPCPMSQWLRSELCRTLRASATWSVADLWSVTREQELWREHLEYRRDWGQQLWRLATARAWWRSVSTYRR